MAQTLSLVFSDVPGKICMHLQSTINLQGVSFSAKPQRKDKETEKSCFQLEAKGTSFFDSHIKNKGAIFPLSNYSPLSGWPVISFR